MPDNYSSIGRREFDAFRQDVIERNKILDDRQNKISADFGDLRATCLLRDDYNSRHDSMEERMRNLELSHSSQLGQIKSLKWIAVLIAPAITALIVQFLASVFPHK